jgi:hypothetical protein
VEQLANFKELQKLEIKKAIIEMNRFENLYEAPDQFTYVLESFNLITNRDWIIMDEVKECFDIIEEEDSLIKNLSNCEVNRTKILGTALHILITRRENMYIKKERIQIFFNSLKMMIVELGEFNSEKIEMAMELGMKKHSNKTIKELIKEMKKEQLKKVFIK